jgi:hypothetical protein
VDGASREASGETIERNSPKIAKGPQGAFVFSKLCGERGIRTLEAFDSLAAFQATQFNHSCTSPDWQMRQKAPAVVVALFKEF